MSRKTDGLTWDHIESALEVHGPLEFTGTPSEQSKAFFLAASFLAEQIASGGMQGIDPARLDEPPRVKDYRGWGGYLVDAIGLLRECDKIANEVRDDIGTGRFEVWRVQRGADARARKELREAGKLTRDQIDYMAELGDASLQKVMRRRDWKIQ